jgi:hypothetical protein
MLLDESLPDHPPLMNDLITMVAEWMQDQPGDLYPESRVDFGGQFGYEGLFGTSDAIIVTKAMIHVADLKYGKVWVDVVKNTQLMIYLSGAVALHGKRKKYRLTIAQPRATAKGAFRSYDLPHSELERFNVELEKAIGANYKRSSKPAAGDHCRNYCPALGTCPAVKEKAIQIFRETPIG